MRAAEGEASFFTLQGQRAGQAYSRGRGVNMLLRRTDTGTKRVPADRDGIRLFQRVPNSYGASYCPRGECANARAAD